MEGRLTVVSTVAAWSVQGGRGHPSTPVNLPSRESLTKLIKDTKLIKLTKLVGSSSCQH